MGQGTNLHPECMEELMKHHSINPPPSPLGTAQGLIREPLLPGVESANTGLEVRCTFQPELAQAPNIQELMRACLGTGSEICLGFASESDQVDGSAWGLPSHDVPGQRVDFAKQYRCSKPRR